VHIMEKPGRSTVITPFDWRRYNAIESGAANAEPRKPAAARARPMTARARTERVLAHRWGNPYCKPGAP
jgi:hypothetical protein